MLQIDCLLPLVPAGSIKKTSLAEVLANGQHMFSCDGSGSYALNILLDANGFAPTIQTFDEFQTRNGVRMAPASECQ